MLYKGIFLRRYFRRLRLQPQLHSEATLLYIANAKGQYLGELFFLENQSMDCDVVYALDASGDAPRIVGASDVQNGIDAIVSANAEGAVITTRKARRDRVVNETGPLACSKVCKMVFRQRSLNGRKPHFAHHAARSSSGGGSGSAACACGGRGGNGHAHIMAQKLIAENIALIDFKHWCPQGLHQLCVRKDTGFTATIEKGARNANNGRVRLDVSVQKNGAFVFAVEVTHTHRVSAASRAGIPYVDVNARETVRRLQSGETTLLCETASNVPACRRCEYQQRCRRRKHLQNWLRTANLAWKLRIRRAFRSLAREMREERAREWHRKMQEEQKEKKCLLWCREALLRRAREATRKAFDFLDAPRRRKMQEEQKEKDRQCEIDRKKRQQRSQWGAFMRHSGRAQSKGVQTFPKRRRVEETGRAKVCFACQNSREINKKQCSHCTKYTRQGWGTEIEFSRKDDDQICKLLNAHGEPMYKDYAPSRMFFYKSVLSFYDAFQHKKWEALVDYIRNEFAHYFASEHRGMIDRGWYKKNGTKNTII